MLGILLKKQLLSFKASILGGKGGKRKAGKANTVVYSLLWIYIAVIMFFFLSRIFGQIAGPFAEAGLGSVYFVIASIMGFAISVVINIFAAKSQLFEAKDNEFLLSLPISPTMIMASRTLLFVLENLAYVTIVMVVSMICYAKAAGVTFGMIVATLGVTLSLTVLGSVLAIILGFLVALIASRVRNKTVVTVVASLAFIALYYYGYSKLFTGIEALAGNVSVIGNKLAFMRIVGEACMGNHLYSLAVLLVSLVIFAATMVFMAKFYIGIVTTKRTAKKIEYKEQNLKISSVRKALVKKEFAHFGKSSTWILNSCIGLIFTIAICVYLLVNPELLGGLIGEITEEAGSEAGSFMILISMIAAGLLSLLCAMNCVSSPSISLEGKSLWIIKTLPIRGKDILVAKMLPHLILVCPVVLFASVTVGMTVFSGADVLPWLLLIFVPQLFVFFVDVLGLWLNLWKPSFDWEHESYPIKQALPAGLTLFGSWGVVGICAAVFFLINKYVNVWVAGCGVVILLVAVDLIMFSMLLSKGSKRFEEIV